MEKIYRILDVNFNRAKEGLRVVEEYYRFIVDDKDMTNKIKNLRHKISGVFSKQDFLDKIIRARDIETDSIAYDYMQGEAKRENINSVLLSNLQRAKESMRVLEEYGKLLSSSLGKEFQALRFELYSIEQALVKRNEELRGI